MADELPSNPPGPNDPPAAASATAVAAPAARHLRADGSRFAGAIPRVGACDFRQPVFLSEGELRRLRSAHEDFVRYLAARLSLYLRMEFGLKLTGLEPVPYAKFTASLPEPAHLTLFRAEPLAGTGIIALSPRLALTIADRLLGGRGHGVKGDRGLTEIEVALLEDIIVTVLEEWCGQWKSEQELRPRTTGHESSGRYLQTSPRDALVLALGLEATFGDCTEPMQLGVPYHLLEPLVRRMQVRGQKEQAVATAAPKRPGWQPAFDQVMMPLRAEWAVLELSLRELASLRAGDLIELPAALLGETRILLNGQPKFAGTAGLDGDRVAVQITRLLPAPETASPGQSDGNKNP